MNTMYEECIKTIEVNQVVKTAGDSIYNKGSELSQHLKTESVPDSIFVSTVQIITNTTYNADGTVESTSTEGLIFHPEYDGWKVYSDSEFCKNVAEAAGLTDFVTEFDFSEQGMQSNTACHLDVELA